MDRNDGGHAPREAAGWEGLSLEHAGAAETCKQASKVSNNAFAVQVGGGPQCLHLKTP